MGAVDPEGEDTKDIVFGIIIGVVTDAIPGTSQLQALLPWCKAP